ncbi:MAG TPA: hypothetical protein PLO85_06120 [Candidatus Omnitrophota bacterium]|nr:hypothetical protein [Candidatus Omnitrophota bacterium]
MKKLHQIARVSLLLFCFVSPAYADMGAPMIFITLPMLIIGLIPIIFLETFVLLKIMRIDFKAALKTSAFMNGISTIIGIPLTWVLLVLLQMFTGGGAAYGLQTPLKKFLAVTWQAPWLIPYESDLYWMIPAASLVLLIPFFFASYFVEAIIARRMQKSLDTGLLKKSVFVANVVSYAILFVLTLAWLLVSLFNGRRSI